MKIIFLSLLMLIPVSLFASPCKDTAESEQWVIVLEGVEGFAAWKVNPDEIHSVSMSNGFQLGLKINPVADGFYREQLEGHSAVPELVELTYFDMSKESPEKLGHSYGGSNSIQGFTPKSGAAAVEDLGDKGMQFFLQKTSCITLDKLANN